MKEVCIVFEVLDQEGEYNVQLVEMILVYGFLGNIVGDSVQMEILSVMLLQVDRENGLLLDFKVVGF